MSKRVEISFRTIIFTIVFLVSLWLLFLIRSILLGLFIALILMSALNPSVKKLEELKIPRWLAILLLYIIAIAVLVLAVSGIIPPLIDQTTTLINSLPDFFQKSKVIGIDEKMVASQLSQFAAIPSNIIRFLLGIFSDIISLFGIGVITFYLLLERKNLDKYLTVLVGEEKQKDIARIIDRIELRLGSWVRGELLLMTFVGVLVYLGFRIIGVDYALPLAILAFLLEIVPNVGPTLAAVPAILIALTTSSLQALAVVGWSFVVQQVENSLLVPRTMKQVVGVNPLVSILALAVGFKLAGVGGAVLAIPTFIVIEVVLSELKLVKGS